MYVYLSVEVTGQRHVALPVFSTFIVLKQGLLLNLELVDSAKGAGWQASRVSLSQSLPVQTCLTVLFFYFEC